ASLYRPIPTMTPSGSGLGWKLAVAAAGLIALLTGIGLALWNRSGSPVETTTATPPAPEETVAGATSLAATPEPAAVTPQPVATPTPAVPRPTPAPARPAL